MNSYHESVEDCGTESVQCTTPEDTKPVRAIIQITGNVQGVGFRPFLYRLATEHGLRGSVANSSWGVDLEIEGPRRDVEAYLADIPRRQPPMAAITELNHRFTEPFGHPTFVIAESERDGHRTALISPDVTVCDDCLDELFDSNDRRYLYPFINCTNCGPRYTIINDVPYDRPATSMSCFTMCPECQTEYEDPTNRRFHAQANACPKCGPHVWLVDSRDVQTVGRISNSSRTEWNSALQDPIEVAAQRLRDGAIVAVKGIGGFHLACDATNAQAVERLRQRKNREEKPFALMVPNLESARQFCLLDAGAESIIASRERPITLLPKRGDAPVADSVAPGNNDLGLMLPYAPLHHVLLFDESRRPRFRALVMTSGNFSDEPIAIGNREALQRLGGLADAFLLHDRDILIRADDSVVRCDSVGRISKPSGRFEKPSYEITATIIRRSRGYVPAPLFLDRSVGEVLAVGGHLKNTIAISRDKTVFLSQHIGDLENLESLEFLRQSVDHLERVLGIRPKIVAHDMHPDYLSTRFAQELVDVQLVPVQHHHAHVAACMAEHGLEGPVIGVALDGTGYGTDGHVWGGEIMIADFGQFERVAHFQEVPMPGNEQAIKQPWRMALSYLNAAFGDEFWSLPNPFVQGLDRPTVELLLRAARQGVNSPLTSSCGRLFDAVAALVELHPTVSYEGQAAIGLEMAMESAFDANKSALTSSAEARSGDEPTKQGRPMIIDTCTLIRSVVADIAAHVPVGVISRRFHEGLAHVLADMVRRVANESDIRVVALGGGCFQNRFLKKKLTESLSASHLSVFSPQDIPPNDGGLALGQIAIAATAEQ